MQNYDGQFKLNGQEYFYRAKDDSGSSKITRVNNEEQHLDRGIKEITTYCEQNNLELKKIFTDQQTGKNFNRPRYQVLKEDVLRAGVRKAPEHDR